MRNDSEDREKLAIRRARRSISCLPFKRAFYEKVDRSSMSADELCGMENWKEYVFVPFGKERAEEHFNWMIKLGILRREVDGQGLTSRIRLTPIGRQTLSTIDGEIARAGIRENITETFRRHRGWL